MKQPSPIKNGFDPITNNWKTEEGKEKYRKEVTEYAKYITYNQKKQIKYNVRFNFTIIEKNSKISGKSGEVEIITDLNQEDLKFSEELKTLITNDMEEKTKKNILLVDITNVIILN